MDDGALFSQYENEYCQKSTEISRQITGLAALTGELRRKKLAEIATQIQEADNVVKRMDMEARSQPAERARQLAPKVKEYRADLAALRDQHQQQAVAGGGAGAGPSSSDAARAELGLGGAGGAEDYMSSAAGQRDRMLAATDRLQKTSDRLQQGKQQLAETEELGVTILEDLARQRETILHARSTLHGADDGIARARKLLSTMSRRITTNRLLMGGIVATLVGAIILLIAVKLRRH